MGLLLTLQDAEEGHGQYRRMLFWCDRVCAVDADRSSDDQLDFLVAFFVACVHPRDWLQDLGVEAGRLHVLFRVPWWGILVRRRNGVVGFLTSRRFSSLFLSMNPEGA
ncbi:hypothetical protein [Burkholderia pseudomallei]|uniref:hypothetical protein n=1 Tax=Burkholderia pseudomallei TaxID=28450 RepID=UPI00052A752F|nr:hypothetical protein [Burkholderia pseudomallei]AIV91247.1 hypothetical protein X995_9 [Burkholderia pseudomallei B03]AIV96862.1 hypothetical protein X996_3438 [Burkholderia pseudomallei A79A]KGY01685.1 hypothetical protein X997_3206 [Burkholderia pseudomallei A79C]KGY04140.1 hypothetical protein Y023_1885 [Burkholderia pseudomallei A79D]